MKIMFVLPASAVGGAEIRFRSIITSLRMGQVSLITQACVADLFSEAHVPIRLFEDYGCTESMPMNFRNMVRYSAAIAQFADEQNVDVIFGVMHVGTLYAAFARDRYRLRAKVVGSLLGNVSAYFAARGKGPSRWERMVVKYMLTRSDRIVVSTRGVRDDLVKAHGARATKVEVINNGIDIDRVRRLACMPVTELEPFSGKTILTACRMNPQKDLYVLVDAFAKVLAKCEARLVLVGGGELLPALVQYAKDVGVAEHVVFCGYQDNPYKYMREADVFVLSSKFEGFGNVIVEAMALGVPVVASDCPSGPSEIIQHGINGYLTAPGDVDALCAAVLHLLLEREDSAKLAAAGRRRAEDFRLEHMVCAYEKVLSAVF